MANDHPLLMLPGPSQPSEEVLKAAASILPHYGREWKKVHEETVKLAKMVFKTSGEVILFPTPGFLAIETGLINLVTREEKILMCVNGYFGETALKAARTHKRNIVLLEKDYGEAITPEDVENALKENEDVRAAFVVYNETSTAVMNPLRELCKVFKEHDLLVMVDAISIFGGAEINMDEWGIDLCVGYASKALGGMPGICPMGISKRLWKILDERTAEPDAWYLDFRTWKKSIEEMSAWGHPHPSSMPTHTVIALHKALKRVIDEGLENVYKRHSVFSAAFRNAVKAMNLQLVAPEEYASPTITAIRLPEGIPKKLIDGMLDNFNIMISGGLGKLAGKIVRVGHMGFTARRDHISRTITALGYTLKELGFNVSVDAALKAFYDSI